MSDTHVAWTLSDYIRTPYGRGVAHYRAAGWHAVIPVDVGRSGPVPKGYTGAKNHMNFPPSDDVYDAWAESHAVYNLGLWLPRDIIGIDVDDYDGRGGADTINFIQHSIAHMPLPPTWTTTARGIGQPSRIHVFRLPFTAQDDRWVSKNGGVDVVRFGHRYVRCWPSIKQDKSIPGSVHGAMYRWYFPDGSLAPHGVVPRPEDLTELPAAWLAGFRRQPRKTRISTSGVLVSGTGVHDGAGISIATNENDAANITYDAHVLHSLSDADRFSELPRGDMDIDDVITWAHNLRTDERAPEEITCPLLRDATHRAVESLEIGNGRHDTALDALWTIINEGALGHVGSLAAIDHLYDTFLTSVCRDGSRSPESARAEWFRLLIGAVERVAGAIPDPASSPACSCAMHEMWARRIINASQRTQR